MKKAFKILTVLSVFTACKNEGEKLKLIENSIKNSSVEVPKNEGDDFELFLKFFNKDSVFQLSRVKFPLISKEQDYENLENDKLLETFIERKDYLKIDLTYNETFKTRE